MYEYSPTRTCPAYVTLLDTVTLIVKKKTVATNDKLRLKLSVAHEVVFAVTQHTQRLMSKRPTNVSLIQCIGA
jgi:hypothetical protein